MHCRKFLCFVAILVFFSSSQAYSALVSVHDFAVYHVNIEPGSTFDLNSNTSWGIVTADPYNKIWNYVVSGYNGGDWNGWGIISSWAQNHPEENGRLAILSGDEYIYDLGQSVFEGHIVAPTDVLIKYTVYGDSTLDGIVDETDMMFAEMGQAMRDAGDPKGFSWVWGNYDYAAVPEPSTILMLGCVGLGLLAARFRKKIR